MALKTKEDFKYEGLLMLLGFFYVCSVPVGGLVGYYFDLITGNTVDDKPVFTLIGAVVGLVVEIFFIKFAKRIK